MDEKKYKKAVTFSFDDGNESDKKLIELFNKYRLKCSFNLNSGLFDKKDEWLYKDKFYVRKPVPFDTSIYEGHEVCVHGLYHKAATALSDEELYEEFAADKRNLEERFGYSIVGAAYAYGAYDDRVVEMLRKLGIKYCRTVQATADYSPQTDMLRYKASCHIQDSDVMEKIEKFLALDDESAILYIWGHSYECDGDDLWERMEKICSLVADRDDILYGTNTEVFEYFNMI